MKPFKITFEDHIATQKLANRYKRWIIPFLFNIGSIAIAITIMIGINVIFDDPLFYKNTILLSFVLIITIIMFITVPIRQKRIQKKVFKSQKIWDNQIQITFDEHKLEWKSKDVHIKLNWDDVIKHKQNDNIIVLYRSIVDIWIIPTRTFENKKELKDFLSNLS